MTKKRDTFISYNHSSKREYQKNRIGKNNKNSKFSVLFISILLVIGVTIFLFARKDITNLFKNISERMKTETTEEAESNREITKATGKNSDSTKKTESKTETEWNNKGTSDQSESINKSSGQTETINKSSNQTAGNKESTDKTINSTDKTENSTDKAANNTDTSKNIPEGYKLDYIPVNISLDPLNTLKAGESIINQTVGIHGVLKYVTDRNSETQATKEVMAGTSKPLQEQDKESEEVFMPGYVDIRTPIKVKGIYVTGPRAGSGSAMNDLIDLVDTTELNAMVIDIKNDSGEVTYNMDLPMVQKIGTNKKYIKDIKALIKKIKKKDIYLIARVVAFKDPILAETKPELSLKNSDGTIFRDKAGHSWVNPYKKEVWDYLVDVSTEAAKLGFDEIQFDYIRFSTDSGMKNVDFGKEAEEKSKSEIITEFTKYAAERLKPLGVYVSADVYGAIIDSKVDAKIVGQNYVQMSKYLDYICPMIYPSHYANGSYGIKYPDLEPYNLILGSLNKSVSVLNVIDYRKNKAEVRPWLQDFTASWLSKYKTYGPEEIRAQIDAVYDAGYEEWILWNGSNKYTEDGLLEH